MQRCDFLNCLAEKIISRKKDKPLKVGIDGRGAAGKTSIADDLGGILTAKGFDVLRPSVDGFHSPKEHRYRQGAYSATGYYEDAYNYQLIIDALLAPLSGKQFPVPCRLVAFDYRKDMPVDSPPLNVGENTILLFEGLFLFRRELNAYWDYRILLSIDAQTSLSRALIRDTESVGTPEEIRRKYAERYEPAWMLYEEREAPETKADVIIDHKEIAAPRFLKAP